MPPMEGWAKTGTAARRLGKTNFSTEDIALFISHAAGRGRNLGLQFAVEREVQFQYVHARFAKEAKLSPFGLHGDQPANVVWV